MSGIRFSKGQEVMVLNVDHKPSGLGYIRFFHPDRRYYTVDYLYPSTGETEEILLPENMLIGDKETMKRYEKIKHLL